MSVVFCTFLSRLRDLGIDMLNVDSIGSREINFVFSS